jgi:hypothetical protein
MHIEQCHLDNSLHIYNTYYATFNSLFARLISHQSAVFFSQNKPATSNQPAVLFSKKKPAPAISHQPNMMLELQLSGMPRLEAAMNEVIAGTNQLERSLAQFVLDEWVGRQVSKGQIDGLLHNIQKMEKKTTSVSNLIGKQQLAHVGNFSHYG